MIPCFFHPTRVVVIDDNHEFLDSLNRTLSTKHASYQYFKNPQKALHYLNKTYQPDPFPNRYTKTFDAKDPQYHCLDVDILHAHHEAYRPQRFEEISVVIVDYTMPGTSGLEVCKQIKDRNIQKILLTGVADESLAIHAFNEGLINHYIRKQDLDMAEQINQAIENAQWRYFNRFSEIALKAIQSTNSHNHALGDLNFQNLFKRLLKQYDFREAYLCESMGSYLFLTEDGSAHGLVVNNEEQFKFRATLGEDQDLDPSLVQELKNRNKMMFHHSQEGEIDIPIEEWKDHLYPTQILQGAHGTYYYAFAPDMFDLDLTRFLSFGQYKAGRRFEIEY